MDKARRTIGIATVAVGGVLLVGLLVAKPFVTVPSGKVGVLSTFGKYDPDELGAGLHFKLPYIQTVYLVDTKVHTINYKGKEDKADEEGIINKPAITVLDQRGLPVKVELSVQYRLKPEMASEMLQTWGKNWEDKLVNPTIREVVRDVIGQYPAETIPTKRQEIANKIEREIRAKLKELSTIDGTPAVQVVGVQLRNIMLPKEVEKKIKEVQIAKQEAEKMKYVEEKARRLQEVEKIKAETKKLKVVISAEATAEANRIIVKSITPEILKWKELEVQMKVAESLKYNPNTTLFINLPQGSANLWLSPNKNQPQK